VTLQPAMIQTGSGWQSTGSGRNMVLPAKSKTPLILMGVFGGILVLVGLAGGAAYLKSHKKAAEDPVVAASNIPSAAPPPSAVVSAPATAPTPTPEPSATTTMAAAVPTTPPSATHSNTAGVGPVGIKRTVTAPTAKVDPPVTPPTTAKPEIKPLPSASSKVQTSR
jgi:hypothetical protein